jgi:hypothetical protein
MRLFALGCLILALPAVSLGTSFDYSSKGSIGAGTATLQGSLRAGGGLTLTVPLVAVNSLIATGTVVTRTGTLTATGNRDVFNFLGGSITIQSGGNTLFQGTFSSGTVTTLGASIFRITGKLEDGALITLTDRHGDVEGDTFTTPEPGTLGLIATGTGLIAIAGLVRRRKRRLPPDLVEERVV